MYTVRIRDLLWLLVFAGVVSGWYGQYRAKVERRLTLEQLIAQEEHKYQRLDDKWNEFARRITQERRQVSNEQFTIVDMEGLAQRDLSHLGQRLAALGVTVPKKTDPGHAHTAITREEEQDLEMAKQEYAVLWAAKHGNQTLDQVKANRLKTPNGQRGLPGGS
jgi:hypothetical protein